MVTARSPRTPRTRSSAGLSQLLGLTLLILGLACAHGTGGSHPATDHSTTLSTAHLLPGTHPTAPTAPTASDPANAAARTGIADPTAPTTPTASEPAFAAARAGSAVRGGGRMSYTARMQGDALAVGASAPAVDRGVTPDGAAVPAVGGLDAASPAGADAAVADSAGVVGRHDPAHPVHECAPLTPRAGTAIGAPAAPAAPGGDRARAGGPGACGPARPAVPAGDTAPPSARGASVLRV